MARKYQLDKSQQASTVRRIECSGFGIRGLLDAVTVFLPGIHGDHFPDVRNRDFAGGMHEAVMADFHEAARQDVLKEPEVFLFALLLSDGYR